MKAQRLTVLLLFILLLLIPSIFFGQTIAPVPAVEGIYINPIWFTTGCLTLIFGLFGRSLNASLTRNIKTLDGTIAELKQNIEKLTVQQQKTCILFKELETRCDERNAGRNRRKGECQDEY